MIKTAAQRRKAKTIMALLNQYSWSVEYAEVRPMATRSLTLKALQTLLKLGKTITCDCSEAITLICRLSGFTDPNRESYNGYGNTTSLLNLPHFTDYKEVHVGTIIVFPEGPGPAHAVMVYEPNGTNPLVYTHGSHARSAIWSLETEKSYHLGQQVILCAVAGL